MRIPLPLSRQMFLRRIMPDSKSWMSRKKRKVNRQRNKPLPEPNLLIVYFVKPKSLHQYDFTHRDVPEAFEGFRIAFVSDLHYKSLLKEQGLNNLVRLLIAQKADVLLMGGDYQEGCEYVEPLFAALSRVKTPMGTYGVMGNNDYERCHDEIVRTMKHYGMRVLEHEVVILLVHTPDYIEDVSVANTDLALAGHTHGGQVRVFGVAPVLNSHYGNRFLTGLAYNTAKIPLIITNGIGTSQLPIRIGAPAEVVMITLHRLAE